EPLRFLLDAQGSKTRANRVVLQRDRRAEHRHYSVASEMVNSAPETLHSCGAAVDKLGHDLAQPLRTDGCCDVHRMNNIGEQHRHLLVFGVGIRLGNGRAASVTEPRVLQRFAATRTARCCCHPTFAVPRSGVSTALQGWRLDIAASLLPVMRR